MRLKLDETLLAPRKVLRTVPCEDGGWLVDLACGHQIWMAVRPNAESHCGQCCQTLIDQIRRIQMQQRLDEYRQVTSGVSGI